MSKVSVTQIMHVVSYLVQKRKTIQADQRIDEYLFPLVSEDNDL